MDISDYGTARLSMSGLESIHGPTRFEIIAQNEDGSRVSCVRRRRDGFPLACSTVRFFADGARALGSHHDRILAGQPVGRTVAESGVGYERSEGSFSLVTSNVATMLLIGGSKYVIARRVTYQITGKPYCEIGEFYNLESGVCPINGWEVSQESMGIFWALQPWIGITAHGTFVDGERLNNTANMTPSQRIIYWYLTERESRLVPYTSDSRFDERRADVLRQILLSSNRGCYLLAHKFGICGFAVVDLSALDRRSDGRPRFRCCFARKTQPTLQQYLRDYVERDLRGS